MEKLFLGVCLGLGVYYLVVTLVRHDGWATVCRFVDPEMQDIYTTDAVIEYLSPIHPNWAKFIGCEYCQTFWFVVALGLGLNGYAIMAALGIAAVLYSVTD